MGTQLSLFSGLMAFESQSVFYLGMAMGASVSALLQAHVTATDYGPHALLAAENNDSIFRPFP